MGEFPPIKSEGIPFTLVKVILDTIVVARGVAALSWERVGRGYELTFKTLRTFKWVSLTISKN